MSSKVSIMSLDTRYRDLRLTEPAAQDSIRRRVEAGAALEPIVVWQGSDGRAVVIDGFKRLDVARLLGRAEVPVEFLAGGEAEAVASIVSLNASRRGLTQMEEAWVVARLCGEHGLSQADVGALMGRHVSWVCRRQMLAERLDVGLQDDVRLGLLSATSAREIARLPRGKQQRAGHCVAQNGLSTRQVAQLCRVLLSCSESDATDEILTDPMRFLRAHDSATDEACDPRLTDEAETVRRVAERLDESARRFRSVLRRYAPGPKAPSDVDVLLPRLRELREELSAAATVLHEFVQTHEDHDDVRSTQLAQIRGGATPEPR